MRNVLFGIGLGLAGARVLRQVAPAFHGLGRPLAKATVKSGLMLFDHIAELRENVQDLAAEARAEMNAEPPPPPAERTTAVAASVQ
jgi:hypothetical protein